MEILGPQASSVASSCSLAATAKATAAAPTAGLYEGKAGVKRLFSADTPIFSAPLAVTIKRMVGEGDTVVAEAEITTKNVDGKVYLNHYSFWMDVRDGKICRVREYLDTLYAQQVLFDPAGIAATAH